MSRLTSVRAIALLCVAGWLDGQEWSFWEKWLVVGVMACVMLLWPVRGTASTHEAGGEYTASAVLASVAFGVALGAGFAFVGGWVVKLVALLWWTSF
jgi:hypothetical protein